MLEGDKREQCYLVTIKGKEATTQACPQRSLKSQGKGWKVANESRDKFGLLSLSP